MAEDLLTRTAATAVAGLTTVGTFYFLRSRPELPPSWRPGSAVMAGVAASVAVSRLLRGTDAGDPHGPPPPRKR